MRSVVVLLVLTTATYAFADETREGAKRHFFEAEKQFQLGHYAEAAREYETGYKLYPRPAFLWNLAQCHRKLGDNERALHFYKQYVVNARPGTKAAANVPEAQEQIRILQALVTEQEKTRTAPPDDVVRQSDAERDTAPHEAAGGPAPQAGDFRTGAQSQTPALNDSSTNKAKWIAGIAVGGGGVVALGLAGLFTGLAVDENRHVVTNDTWSPATEDRRNSYEATATALYVLGGVAVVTGATLYVLGKRRENPGRRSDAIAPAIGQSRIGLVLIGRF